MYCRGKLRTDIILCAWAWTVIRRLCHIAATYTSGTAFGYQRDCFDYPPIYMYMDMECLPIRALRRVFIRVKWIFLHQIYGYFGGLCIKWIPIWIPIRIPIQPKKYTRNVTGIQLDLTCPKRIFRSVGSSGLYQFDWIYTWIIRSLFTIKHGGACWGIILQSDPSCCEGTGANWVYPEDPTGRKIRLRLVRSCWILRLFDGYKIRSESNGSNESLHAGNRIYTRKFESDWMDPWIYGYPL